MSKDFLSVIIDSTKHRVSQAQMAVPFSEIRQLAGQRVAEQRFCDALSRDFDAINIIAEIKRASPSKGDICADLDVATTAMAYENAGAAAISVLTEPQYFKGSTEDLKAVRKSVEIPILRKDFIISEYQIYESAAIGADAILLIVRTLEPAELHDFLQLAQSIDLDCLVEVYSPEDVDVAIKSEASLIGINNRDLRSFNIDIKNALQLTTALEGYQIPIAASGIESPRDIELNKAHGISSFLVGESIMRCGNIGEFIRGLKGTQR